MIIAGLVLAAAQGPVNQRIGIIIKTKSRMGRFDQSVLALINYSLEDNRAHVSVAVQIKDFNIDLIMGGFKVAGTFI
jgi:hypothetical protein